MLRLTKRLSQESVFQTTLTLPLELRVKSRQRVTLDDGSEAGLFLDRGTSLRDGDLLSSDDGFVVRVVAAPERVSRVTCIDPLTLARACYHLGNRHVPLQIEAQQVIYQHDHVLDDMVQSLGLTVNVEDAPFEPEPGAYGGHHSGHGHAHEN